ncbi:MAG: GTPase, partial [Candidatus Woesearchaeota archaeon]
MAINTLIMGAAGRDFHNFLTYFKNNKMYNLKCFTANQIPGISGKKFPKELSGSLYKNGISIYDEKDLPKLIISKKIELCVLSYSDLSNSEVMNKVAYIQSLGCDFMLLGPNSTQINSKRPVISVTAVRTGCGKSQVT